MFSSGMVGANHTRRGRGKPRPRRKGGARDRPANARRNAGARVRTGVPGETYARRRPTTEGDRRRREERRSPSEPTNAYEGERLGKKFTYLTSFISQRAPTSGGDEGTDAFTPRPHRGSGSAKVGRGYWTAGQHKAPYVLPRSLTRKSDKVNGHQNAP